MFGILWVYIQGHFKKKLKQISMGFISEYENIGSVL